MSRGRSSATGASPPARPARRDAPRRRVRSGLDLRDHRLTHDSILPSPSDKLRATLAASPRARRAHAGLAPASPHAGVTVVAGTRSALGEAERRPPREHAAGQVHLARRLTIGLHGRYDAGPQPPPGLDPLGDVVVLRPGEERQVERDGRAPTSRERWRTARSGAQQWTTLVAPAATTASSSQSSVWAASAAVTERCREKPLAVGTAPASTAGSAGSSSCTTTAAPCERGDGCRRRGRRTASARAWARSRRAPMSASDLVAAGALDQCCQRPRPDDLDLEGIGTTVTELFDPVEVLRQQRPGSSLVRTRRIRQPPPGWLKVGTQPADEAERAADHRRRGTTVGELGEERQVADFAQHDLEAVDEVLAGHRADAGRLVVHPRRTPERSDSGVAIATSESDLSGGLESLGDGRAADDPGTGVQHRRLAGRDPGRGFEEIDVDPVIGDPGDGRMLVTMGP